MFLTDSYYMRFWKWWRLKIEYHSMIASVCRPDSGFESGINGWKSVAGLNYQMGEGNATWPTSKIQSRVCTLLYELDLNP